jgi:hypothetical protein
MLYIALALYKPAINAFKLCTLYHLIRNLLTQLDNRGRRDVISVFQ